MRAKSRYDETYKEIITEEFPEYVKRENKEKKLGLNVENIYWVAENESKSRLCGIKREATEQIMKECEKVKETNTGWVEIIKPEKDRVEMMKRISRKRKKLS